MKEQSTEEQMRDLAAAVIEALTVPFAARPEDEREAASLLRSRAASVRGALSCITDLAAEPKHATVAVRQQIADTPVIYEPFVFVEDSAVSVAALPEAWHAAGAA